jgi:hypothetical protein
MESRQLGGNVVCFVPRSHLVYVFDIEPFLPPVRERKGINGKNDESDDDVGPDFVESGRKCTRSLSFLLSEKGKALVVKMMKAMMMHSPELMESGRKCTTRSCM